MRVALAQTLSRLAHWLRPKNAPASLTGNQWVGGPYTANITNHFNELAIPELATNRECA